MNIYPAIDLIGGKVVRLHKGDFAQQITYGSDPIAVAQSYADQGAKWLHLVDLDGAKNPENRQLSLISDIIANTGLKVQTGGGIRSIADVEKLAAAGASRIVIGSLAVKDHAAVAEIFATFGGDAICLAADVIPVGASFNIAVSGWQEASDLGLYEFLQGYMPHGLRHALCTDIDRDGTMTGCNRELYAAVTARFPDLCLQASGGVSKLADLDDLGTDGVIIGKALYEGEFSVADAIGRAGGDT